MRPLVCAGGWLHGHATFVRPQERGRSSTARHTEPAVELVLHDKGGACWDCPRGSRCAREARRVIGDRRSKVQSSQVEPRAATRPPIHSGAHARAGGRARVGFAQKVSRASSRHWEMPAPRATTASAGAAMLTTAASSSSNTAAAPHGASSSTLSTLLLLVACLILLGCCSVCVVAQLRRRRRHAEEEDRAPLLAPTHDLYGPGAGSGGTARGRGADMAAIGTPARDFVRLSSLPPSAMRVDEYGRRCMACNAENECVALRPCGHAVLCRACSDFVYTCPHCGGYISGIENRKDVADSAHLSRRM